MKHKILLNLFLLGLITLSPQSIFAADKDASPEASKPSVVTGAAEPQKPEDTSVEADKKLAAAEESDEAIRARAEREELEMLQREEEEAAKEMAELEARTAQRKADMAQKSGSKS